MGRGPGTKDPRTRDGPSTKNQVPRTMLYFVPRTMLYFLLLVCGVPFLPGGGRSAYSLQLAATILIVSTFSFGALAELDDPAGAEELGMLSTSPVTSTL